MILHQAFFRIAETAPEALALGAPGGDWTYGNLAKLARCVANYFHQIGLRSGDRVGIWLEKSPAAVAAMLAASRQGLIYVPLDPMSPRSRVHKIIADCAPALVIVGKPSMGIEARQLHLDPHSPELPFASPAPEAALKTESPAYILYTSGSTGTPKGVCISHGAAAAFFVWAAEALGLTAQDRLANHAPFHFDLSIFDLFAAFYVGASVHLIPSHLALSPKKLTHFIQHRRISVWYSVPSALTLMMNYGGLLEAGHSPRIIIFAGEVFPIQHLRRLRRQLPDARLFNFYGPTETNVCTYYEVDAIEPDRIQPVPIGYSCSGDVVWARKEDGTRVSTGERGELMVEGPTVMLGYWGKPPHVGPYATGDMVVLLEDGGFQYLGRRDQMLKIRGNRIEPGEIEACLSSEFDLAEVAVTAIGVGLEKQLAAFIGGTVRPSLLAVKRACAQRLPPYMNVESLIYLDALPRNGNGKIDRGKLQVHLTETESRSA